MHREKWNQRYREKEPYSLQKPGSNLEKTIAGLAPGKALDMASGDGRNSIYLAQKGWDVTAVDFSDAAAELGKKLAQERGVSVHWEVQDLNAYTPEAGQYDLVCIFYLHLPTNEFAQILKKAEDALKTGGTLLVVGHDRTNIGKGVGGPQNPDILYTPDEITKGLGTIEIEYAAQETHAPDHGDFAQGSIQIDCVVRGVKK